MAPILCYPSPAACRARRLRRWTAHGLAAVAVLACAAAALLLVRLHAPHLVSPARTPVHVETGPTVGARPSAPPAERPQPAPSAPLVAPPPALPTPPPPPTAAGTLRVLAVPGAPAGGAQSVERILGSVPSLAAASGAAVHVGEAPMAPGHWGVYEPRTNVVYVSSAAFSDGARLHYVVAHELAHAYWYQVATGTQRLAFAAAVAGGPAVRGGAGELYADCVASLWGATTSYYWTCPAPARDAIATAMTTPMTTP